MIFATVKMLHLLAMALGAAASFGNVFLLLARGPHDLPAPALENALRRWWRQAALVAILTLWATGLFMAVVYDGWPSSYAFNMKLALAFALLLLIGWFNWMAPGWSRRGGPPSYVSALHIAGAMMLIAAIVFGVFSFA